MCVVVVLVLVVLLVVVVVVVVVVVLVLVLVLVVLVLVLILVLVFVLVLLVLVVLVVIVVIVVVVAAVVVMDAAGRYRKRFVVVVTIFELAVFGNSVCEALRWHSHASFRFQSSLSLYLAGCTFGRLGALSRRRPRCSWVAGNNHVSGMCSYVVCRVCLYVACNRPGTMTYRCVCMWPGLEQ